MKTLLFTLLIFIAPYCYGQLQDNTDIKLQKYKDYFDKGLITQADYELLKEQLLQLGKFSPRTHILPNTGVMQYDKKTTFEIRMEPTLFFSLPSTYKTAQYSTIYGSYTSIQKSSNQQYGNIDFGFGAAFSKRYHIHFTIGFDGNNQTHILTTGADLNINLLSGRVSPFIHLGGGYSSVNLADDDVNNPLNGFYTGAGIGVYIQLVKFCALDISPDFRFLYGYSKQSFNSNASISWQSEQVFVNQLGVRMGVVFY